MRRYNRIPSGLVVASYYEILHYFLFEESRPLQV